MAIAVCLPILAAPLHGFAATISSASEITLDGTQSEFSLSVAVEQPEAYAGAEFAIECGEGVAVKSVSYGRDVMSAGPTDARGLTWFSFFSDENEYSGSVSADIALEYAGEADSYVEIDRVKVYTVEGGTVNTAVNEVGRRIPISRAVLAADVDEGAQALPDEAVPLDAAPEIEIPAALPSPEAGLGGAGAKAPEDAAGAAVESAPGAATEPAGVYGAATEGGDPAYIDDEAIPMSDIQGEGGDRLQSLLTLLLLVSLVFNLLLGYLNIRRKRSDETSA
ncbi:MAG: hypothetical protein LBS32_00180 [Clostridiales Family XIII bacterium]|nr:hypothetical protein [Clostridiales Family XIII bacterium]